MSQDPNKYDMNAYMKPVFTSREEKEREEVEREKLRQLRRNDMIDILNTPAGLRLFRDMILTSGMFGEEFTGNSKTYFDQGMKVAALKYFNLACEANQEFKQLLVPPYDKIPYDPNKDEGK